MKIMKTGIKKYLSAVLTFACIISLSPQTAAVSAKTIKIKNDPSFMAVYFECSGYKKGRQKYVKTYVKAKVYVPNAKKKGYRYTYFVKYDNKQIGHRSNLKQANMHCNAKKAGKAYTVTAKVMKKDVCVKAFEAKAVLHPIFVNSVKATGLKNCKTNPVIVRPMRLP